MPWISLLLGVIMFGMGMTLNLALLHFGLASALPGALFSVWHNISGSLLATLWSRSIDDVNSPGNVKSIDTEDS